jgi:hypothetical protein
MHNSFRSILALAAAFGVFSCGIHAREQKLKSEDVVQKHLDSIGSAQKRAAIKTRSITGGARMKVEVGAQGPAAQGLVAGTLALASSGSKYKIALPFNYVDYWGEQFVYNGAKAQVAFSYTQQRAPLADFIFRYDMVLQEGLFGGVLSTAWPFLELGAKQPRLEYTGLKTVGGEHFHVLTYRRKKGQADMRIELFFEAETFRHVRTAYNMQMLYESSAGVLDKQQRQEQPTVYRLEEYFSGFEEFDGITLPTRWNILFERSASNRTSQWEYAVVVSKVVHNQPLADAAFTLDQREK